MSWGWEAAANLFNGAAIVLAGLNSVHTWWTGIVGCALFGFVFWQSQLFADATLQAFFVITSGVGWARWTGRGRILNGEAIEPMPVRRVSPRVFGGMVAGAIGVAVGYGWLLQHWTNAYAPYVDSLVLTFSVLGQLLLMERRYECWWCWLAVNTLAVPLFFSRELFLTSALYAGYWVNAWLALGRWRRLVVS